MTIIATRTTTYTVNGQQYTDRSTASIAYRKAAVAEFWAAQGLTPGQVNAVGLILADSSKATVLINALQADLPTFPEAP